ncbi:lysM domain-containing GPI-anchored protein 1-like [Phoenix dactylifera]|uniref:LysM domain-containing GPI-anchored protein 1-like n=1 Tax=Phoenix dactylifera TaxID=42345 RepID=A0A8B9A3H7_PHODC|nr:lysM domain-containing GPI-anchored protein 1-like [Phoenix dactylifera]
MSRVFLPAIACASLFPRYASDFGLVVANGSYAITASHCVQCSCGPASLAVSCSSMQCRNSNLMLGNVTAQPTSAGCNVTSCSYGGFENGTIMTMLTTSLQPRCPGQHQFPPIILPPSALIRNAFLAPSPSPVQSQPGGALTTPKSSVPGTFTLPGGSPANGPSGSMSEAPTVKPLKHILVVFIFCQVPNFLL